MISQSPDSFGGRRIENTGHFENYGLISVAADGVSFIENYYSGSIENRAGASLLIHGSVSNYGSIINSGTVSIDTGSLTNAGGSYTQTGGVTVMDGQMFSNTLVDIQGGMLMGIGTINGDVKMGGTMAPGDSPGKFTINGNYTQLSSGTFFAELAGLTAGTGYDQLAVSGTVALDGTLDVDLLDGFFAHPGDSFVLMTFSSETGQFSAVDLPGPYWGLQYNPTNITVYVTPEPSTLLLLGGALSLFGYRLRLLRNRD